MSLVKKHIVKAAAISVAAVFSAGAASAATVEFGPTGWTNEGGSTVGTDYLASIEDIAGGVSFSLALTADSVDTGDILLIGFEGVNLSAATLDNVVTSTGDAITAVCTNVSSCGGGGGGFTGGIFNSFTFDTLLRIGTSGSASGLNTSISFDALLAGLTSADFSAIGLRIQTVGTSPDGGGGSLKIWNDDPTTPAPVPLPAGGLLLLTGMGGMFVARRRKQR